jgi:hypothetical protein
MGPAKKKTRYLQPAPEHRLRPGGRRERALEEVDAEVGNWLQRALPARRLKRPTDGDCDSASATLIKGAGMLASALYRR